MVQCTLRHAPYGELRSMYVDVDVYSGVRIIFGFHFVPLRFVGQGSKSSKSGNLHSTSVELRLSEGVGGHESVQGSTVTFFDRRSRRPRGPLSSGAPGHCPA